MTNIKRTFSYLFLFIIPYGLAILLIGTSYNALVIHWSSRWRLAVGAIVGTIFMSLLKIIVQKPLALLNQQVAAKSHVMRFFLISGQKSLAIFNLILDVVLTLVGIYAARRLFSPQFINGTALGWLLISLFCSAMIGAYFAFDQLHLDKPLTKA